MNKHLELTLTFFPLVRQKPQKVCSMNTRRAWAIPWRRFVLYQQIFLAYFSSNPYNYVFSCYQTHAVRAQVVELVDASDSKSDPERGAGSIPALGTTEYKKDRFCGLFYVVFGLVK